MNFALNLSLKIFLTGVAILVIAMIIVYRLSYNNTIRNELDHAKSITDELSVSIDNNILEKIKTTQAIASSPGLISALEGSNAYYGSLSIQNRDKKILSQNEKWLLIEELNNPFILQYTDNKVARYLKNIQNNLRGEYGEIFLTNKFGALVASTGKLTTFAHGHKYWWLGAYDEGKGAVFFDDRGYDDSVGGYVFGVVIPIKKGDEIIGVLKANLNVLGSISKILLSSKSDHLGKLQLIRSGGLIIFEEGVEPMSKTISIELLEKLHANKTGSFTLKEEDNELIVSASEIGITANMEGSGLGASFESSDHKRGNLSESWYILSCRPITNVLIDVGVILKRLLLIGLILSVFLALTALIIGAQTAKPIKGLMRQTELIAMGDFASGVSVKRKDEIGLLASSFNKMAKNLNETTTSIDKLNTEIEERKRIELTLKESEERFRAIFEQAAVGVIQADTNTGNFVRVNQKYLDIVGYTQEELFKLNFRDITHQDDLEMDIKNLSLLQSGKISYFDLEKRYIRKGGSIVWVKITVSHLTHDVKFSKQLIVVVEDITERVKAEKDLLINMQLLKEQNEELDTFSHTVAHDLKNPLGTILGFAGLLSEDYQSLSKDDILKYSSRIVQAGEKTQQIINSLLLFANVRKSEVQAAELNMAEIVSETMSRLKQMINDKNAKITVSDAWPKAFGYSPWIEEVWINYLSNAIKYGGSPPHIEIGAEAVDAENMIRFWVKDNGSGISAENQKRLFNKFERLDQVKIEGHGLGLSIVSRIIEKLGGEVGVESDPDGISGRKGSLFYFTLPRKS